MARKLTLQQIQDQIAVLQRKADALKDSEKAGVIDKIKVAIEHYGITPAELFEGRAKPAKAPAKTTRKGSGVVKYRDGAGHTWTGFGPKPRWFTEALAGGKTVEDLRV